MLNREIILFKKFTGRWYEIEHSFYLMELIKSCISFDLIENDKGRIEISVNTKSTMSGRLSINGGVASASKKDPSLFIYKVSSPLPRVINKYLPGAGLYQVLHTDYKDYAIVYSCTNFHVLYIGIDKECVRQILHESFNMLSVYAKMVPNPLTPEQKESRMNICADILNNIDTDSGFLDTVTLKGTKFESVEAVKAKATEVLNQLTEADFQHCFQQWKSRMKLYRDRQGEYIEGEKVATVIDFIWIWGRRTEIGAETRAEIYSLLDSYDIDSERLILSKNDNCTDY
ncbi:hypothetical protein NQ318_010458 [Aromia moschata]|uniref:Uncharacterized protein n=1 Tax=Aromia moschata TaxID=1265417 RepID=A0AAV8Y9J0_9CUCU|nr:hypothetical protein NQ318_010458 [Aromia moschata]